MRVIESYESYEQMQENMALLKILALGTRQVEEGETQLAGDIVQRLRNRSKNADILSGMMAMRAKKVELRPASYIQIVPRNV